MVTRLIFIGGGNMTQAILNGLYHDNAFNLLVIQKNAAKLALLNNRYPQISCHSHLDFMLNADDIVILAIKPQDGKVACAQIKPYLHENTTIVSIMAGINVSTLANWLGNDNLVRVMPNTAAAHNLSVNGIYCSKSVLADKQSQIAQIFASIGSNYILQHEDGINKITAIAGSAPAYLLYFLEAMINSATEQFAFSKNDAQTITMQVLEGVLALIKADAVSSPTQLAELSKVRTNITSKKGTTQAAIAVFDKHHLAKSVYKAEEACYKRAQELSQSFAQ